MKNMKLIQKNKRTLQLKEGNKIIFNIHISDYEGQEKLYYSYTKGGVGIVADCKNLDECIDETFKRIDMMNTEFKKKLITV